LAAEETVGTRHDGARKDVPYHGATVRRRHVAVGATAVRQMTARGAIALPVPALRRSARTRTASKPAFPE
jgi:hypothetical protein